MKKFLSEAKLNEIRGKVLVGMATRDEMLCVFEHLDSMEYVLNDSDMDDTFGTEGWREFFGLPE